MSMTNLTSSPAPLAETDLDAVAGGTIFRVNQFDAPMIVKKPPPSQNSSGFTANGTGSETHDPKLKEHSNKI